MLKQRILRMTESEFEALRQAAELIDRLSARLEGLEPEPKAPIDFEMMDYEARN
jgi:hypothetical protein